MPLRLRKPRLWLTVIGGLLVALSLLIPIWSQLRTRWLIDEFKAHDMNVVTESGSSMWPIWPNGEPILLRWTGDVVAIHPAVSPPTIGQHELSRLLGRLHYFSKLTWLDLTEHPVSDDDLRCLANLAELDGLHLSQTPITDHGLRWVACCRDLKELDLSGTEITDAGLRQLGTLNRLESLTLDGTRVGDAGMAWLAGHAPRLTDLSVSNTNVTDAGLQALAARIPGLAVTDD